MGELKAAGICVLWLREWVNEWHEEIDELMA